MKFRSVGLGSNWMDSDWVNLGVFRAFWECCSDSVFLPPMLYACSQSAWIGVSLRELESVTLNCKFCSTGVGFYWKESAMLALVCFVAVLEFWKSIAWSQFGMFRGSFIWLPSVCVNRNKYQFYWSSFLLTGVSMHALVSVLLNGVILYVLGSVYLNWSQSR